ncbi:MAG: hypothetical protein IJL29_02645 [Prevotella sp.]|nr:hypothetical protein [Prevotella sp.]
MREIQVKRYSLMAIIVMMLVLSACSGKVTNLSQNETPAPKEVSFEVAKHYFLNRGQETPANPKITTQEEFSKLFGMAAVMGKDGMPTKIDFSKQFVVALVRPITNIEEEIIPVKVEEMGDTLRYTYEIKSGEEQSFSMQPLSIIILDKKYENKEIILDSNHTSGEKSNSQ